MGHSEENLVPGEVITADGAFNNFSRLGTFEDFESYTIFQGSHCERRYNVRQIEFKVKEC